MVDDSELDYIRTFLGKVHTVMTFKGFHETKNITQIADTQRGLVYPPEIINGTDYYTKKRYNIKLSETTEANLSTAIDNILIGCRKLNRKIAITTYTKPASLSKIIYSGSNKAYEHPTSKRWVQDIQLDVIWRVD